MSFWLVFWLGIAAILAVPLGAYLFLPGGRFNKSSAQAQNQTQATYIVVEDNQEERNPRYILLPANGASPNPEQEALAREAMADIRAGRVRVCRLAAASESLARS